MTNQQKAKYKPVEDLRKIFTKLTNQKFQLDCGHHVTFGQSLGNNITVLNGNEPIIVCTLCRD